MSNKEYLQFWEGRYAKQQYEWGKKPSILVSKALEHIPGGAAVLDVACGYGRDTISLARSGYRAYGMDFSALAIKRARDWAEQ